MAKFIILCLLLLPSVVKAEMVMFTEAGMTFYGDSGVNSVDRLERHELATSNVRGIGVGYQREAYGGRWRVLGGIEHSDIDGDWGVHQTDGLARQTVQISATSFALRGEYDFRQVRMGGLYPFVTAGVSLNINRPENATVIEYPDGEDGCVSDNGDTMSFGYSGGAGVAYETGRLTWRVFYQYSDKGRADTSCDNGPAGYEGYSVGIKEHAVRVGVLISF